MSVPASKRSLSDREFYHNAIAIRVEVTKLMTRERRRLRRLAHMARGGRISWDDVTRSYQSWRGGLVGLDAHGTVAAMDRAYRLLMKGATDERIATDG